MITRSTFVSTISTICIAILATGFVFWTGCVRGADKDQPSNTQGGRIVTPTPDSSIQGSEQNGTEAGTDDTSGGQEPGQGGTWQGHYEPEPGDGTEPGEERAEMSIRLLINDQPWQFEQPLRLRDGEQVNAKFLIAATVSELARYRIDTAAPVPIPQEGELSGFSATVEYTFSYDSQTWGPGGVMITVMNRQQDLYARNIQIEPLVAPGQPEQPGP